MRKQAGFQFLDEQALATDLGQRRVEDLVTLGFHLDQLDFELGVEFAEAAADLFGLPQGKRTAASGNF